MPYRSGMELAQAILRVKSEAIILIYTGFDIMTHYNLLMDSGVAGFISKTATAEQLITSIRCALRGEVVIPLQLLKKLRRVKAIPSTAKGQKASGDLTLPDWEQQILNGVAKWLTNKEIAAGIAMSKRTIEYDLSKVFLKLGVSSRTEALMKAQQSGLLSTQTTEK